MADRAGTVGVPGFEDSTAGNYPPFKPSEEAGARATPTLEDLQALDSRGVAKGRDRQDLMHRKREVVRPATPMTRVLYRHIPESACTNSQRCWLGQVLSMGGWHRVGCLLYSSLCTGNHLS